MARLDRARAWYSLFTAVLAISLTLFSCGQGKGSAAGARPEGSEGEQPGAQAKKAVPARIAILDFDSAPSRYGDLAGSIRVFAGELRGSAKIGNAIREAIADPQIEAIILSYPPEGAAAAIDTLRAELAGGEGVPPRPMLFVAVDPAAEALEVEEAADFVVANDSVAEAYGSAWAGSRLGCSRLIYVKTKSKDEDPAAEAQRLALGKAATLLGIAYAELESPFKPEAGTNAAGARESPSPEAVAWIKAAIEAGGGEAAWFLADEAARHELLAALMATKSVLVGPWGERYPELFAVPAGVAGPAEQLHAIEKAIADRAIAARVVLPGFPQRFALEAAAVELLRRQLGYGPGFEASPSARRARTASAEAPASDDLVAALKVAAPGIAWRVDHAVDRETGVRARNHLVAFQDMYVVGRGYLPFTRGEVPAELRRE